MNHFARVHQLAEQRRQDREDALPPMASRITELECALRDLIKAGDSLKLPTSEQNRWHGAARDAEIVLADA